MLAVYAILSTYHFIDQNPTKLKVSIMLVVGASFDEMVYCSRETHH
jgi:hypothetical protein